MAYTSNFVLTTVEGTLTGGTGTDDIWRTTFKIPTPGAIPSKEDLEGYLDDVSGTIAGYHGASQVFAGGSAKLVSLAAAVLGPDGKYVGGGEQETARYTYSSPIAGAGTTVASWATAVCVSMRTPRPRGRASKGRMYWPATAVQTGVDGLLESAQQTNYIAQALGLLNNINIRAVTAFGGGPLKVAVMSQMGSGTTDYVTHVSVGRKVDHQERREGESSEAHIWTPLTGALAAVEEYGREWRERAEWAHLT